MKFLNKQEQVIDLQLTQYGKYLLSTGKFKPVFYAFFDDGILYDPNYGYGPQQQKEPDGTGDGFWPNTNPFINISNIFIKNIKVDYVETQHSGILRCNISNPCKNITTAS